MYNINVNVAVVEWQTRETQNLMIFDRVGSSPTCDTIFNNLEYKSLLVIFFKFKMPFHFTFCYNKYSMMEVILAMVALSFILLFNGLYFYFKFHKALLVFQQGAYSNTRMINYIKGHYKYCSGINELCLLIPMLLVFINPNNSFLALILMFFFSYYNLRFYNLNAKRYDTKLKLNITQRVKRLIFTFVLLIVIIFGICIGILHYVGLNFLQLNFYVFLYSTLVIVTYLIFWLVILANTINIPCEKMVKNHYKTLARKKLLSMNNLEVIGITGSFGKTSTKNIVGSILQSQQPTLITPSSFNTPMGLCMTVDKDLSPFHRYFIAEMGAYRKGEIKELVDLVRPKYGIVTSVGHQHLETFKTIDNVCNTKMELIEGLPADGLGIINYDNEYIKNYKIKNNVAIKTYSLKDPSADIYATNIIYNEAGTSFDVHLDDQIYHFTTTLLGQYNIENILAAILLADHLGYSIDVIQNAVAKLKPVKNRLELKHISNDTIIIDDAFNANELGIKEAIRILGTYDKWHRILITPGLIDLGNKSQEIHQDLGKYLTKYCDTVYIVGNENQEDILAGIKKTNFELDNVKCVDNFMQAYNQAMSYSGKKVILIANDLPDKFNN